MRTGVGRIGGSLLLVAVALARVDAAPRDIVDDPRHEAGAAFGSALAFADGRLAVGAPGAAVLDLDGAGVVQLFGTDGTLERTLTAANPVAGAGLGSTMVGADGLLYASAPGDVPIGLGGTGAIYVFDAASGGLVRIVSAPDPDAGTVPVGGTAIGDGLPSSLGEAPVAMGFGRALAVAADRIVVGAPDSLVDDVPGAGAVYVYDREGGLVRTLRDFSPAENAHFGAAVAVADGRLLVGVPGAADGVGVVRVLDLVTGRSIRTLSASIAVEGAALGASVGVIDGNIFAGAPGDQVLGVEGVGAVYLFDRDTGALVRIVTPPLAVPGLQFGRVVAVANGDLLVAAVGATVLGVERAGEVFVVDPATARVRTTFEPITPRTGGLFGLAIALTGTTVAIGEPASGSASAVGRVYVFGPPRTQPRTARRRTATEPSPAGAGCPLAVTATSVECRLAALAPHVGPHLGRTLRRALRETRRADAAEGARRLRAFRSAARHVRGFIRAVAVRGVPSGMSADRREAVLAAANSAEADLRTLAR